MNKTKGEIIQTVNIGDEEVAIIRLEQGGLMGVDVSFIEQNVGPVYSAFDKGVEVEIQDEGEQ